MTTLPFQGKSLAAHNVYHASGHGVDDSTSNLWNKASFVVAKVSSTCYIIKSVVGN